MTELKNCATSLQSALTMCSYAWWNAVCPSFLKLCHCGWEERKREDDWTICQGRLDDVAFSPLFWEGRTAIYAFVTELLWNFTLLQPVKELSFLI